MKENVAATVREKVFWDDIPGFVMYTEHYDEEQHTLKGVIIHDGRDQSRPLTIFAADGIIGGGPNRTDIRLALNNGSIHSVGKEEEYRLVHFGEYVMTVAGSGHGTVPGRIEFDMSIGELLRKIENPATKKSTRLKMTVGTEQPFCLSVCFAGFCRCGGAARDAEPAVGKVGRFFHQHRNPAGILHDAVVLADAG